MLCVELLKVKPSESSERHHAEKMLRILLRSTGIFTDLAFRVAHSVQLENAIVFEKLRCQGINHIYIIIDILLLLLNFICLTRSQPWLNVIRQHINKI